MSNVVLSRPISCVPQEIKDKLDFNRVFGDEFNLYEFLFFTQKIIDEEIDNILENHIDLSSFCKKEFISYMKSKSLVKSGQEYSYDYKEDLYLIMLKSYIIDEFKRNLDILIIKFVNDANFIMKVFGELDGELLNNVIESKRCYDLQEEILFIVISNFILIVINEYENRLKVSFNDEFKEELLDECNYRYKYLLLHIPFDERIDEILEEHLKLYILNNISCYVLLRRKLITDELALEIEVDDFIVDILKQYCIEFKLNILTIYYGFDINHAISKVLDDYEQDFKLYKKFLLEQLLIKLN